MPSPPPAAKLKRLKFDCAEAETMNPQTVSNKSIRFLNLDLLFPGTTLLQPYFRSRFNLDAFFGRDAARRGSASTAGVSALQPETGQAPSLQG